MINGFLRNKKMSLFWAKARMRLGRERRCKWHRMWGTVGPWLVPPAQRGTKLRDEGAEMGGFGRFGMKWVANNKLQGIHQRGRLNYDCRGTIIRLGWRFASEVKWQQEICCLGSFQQRQLTLSVSHFKSTPLPLWFDLFPEKIPLFFCCKTVTDDKTHLSWRLCKIFIDGPALSNILSKAAQRILKEPNMIFPHLVNDLR